VKKFFKHFRYGQRGFTLIELLVVIGILGAIAAIVVPNVGQFIGRGKTESYSTELHNIETSVMAMMVDDADSTLDTVPAAPTTDMSTVTGTDIGGTTLYLYEYITGLAADDPTTTVVETADPPIYTKLGCTYSFTTDGHVTQSVP
jgi:prepilin-type N-terminal cleavage/methylation domain-containing protein